MFSKDTLTGQVVAPWDPGYDQDRLDYNARFDHFYPDYIVYCQAPEDVGRAIRWARCHALPFRIRSGGHSYEAYSLVNRGLIIDVSALNRVAWDPDSGIATIGAGAKLLEVYEALWNAGQVTIPGGSCPTVGIAGRTLGGGFGLISRQFGLTVDALESLMMYDARGCPVSVSDQCHPDLFWALRGAGANNFGAVTEFQFRTVSVADPVTIFALRWDWSRLRAVTRGFQLWSDPTTLDPRLTGVLTLPSDQQHRVSIIGEFLGYEAELTEIIAPLTAILGLETATITAMSYIDAVKHFAGVEGPPGIWLAQGVPEHDTFKNTSAYAYEIFPDGALDVMQDALSHTPGAACLVQLGTFGGAIREVRPDATAFYHRRARSEMQYQAYWSDPSVADAHIRWVERLRRAMKPYTVGAYVNYCDSKIRRWPEEYWGGNLERLLSVKRRWDPHRVFRYPQGLSELI